MPLNSMPLNRLTLSSVRQCRMILGRMTLMVYHDQLTVLLNVILLNAIVLNVTTLHVTLLYVTLLNVTLLNASKLNGILLSFIMFNIIRLSVIMLNAIQYVLKPNMCFNYITRKGKIETILLLFCGLYYKPMMILNDDSRVIIKLETSLTDDAIVVIYDHHMFIAQATDCFS